MPVFAEKEPTNLNLVEPSLNVSNIKEAAASPVEVQVNQHEERIEESREETVIVFDWDDTLLCSSHLSSQGYRLDTDLELEETYPAIRSELQQLESHVISVLKEALKRGKVNIITNAEAGWVELSARKYLPGVVPFLSYVNVISARSTYEHLYPGSPLKWKFSAFQERLSSLLSAEKVKKNVISFGDSHVEREAVRTVTQGVANTKTKSIKFAEGPSIEQLSKQLELVINSFQYIISHEGNLDLMLKMTVTPTASS